MREVVNQIGGADVQRPLSLNEAKGYLGVDEDDNDHDTSISQLLKQAEELVSRYIGEPLVSHKVDEFYDRWGCGLLLKGKTTTDTVTGFDPIEVAYFDTTRTEQTLTINTDWFLDDTGDQDAIKYEDSFGTPALHATTTAPIRVSYPAIANNANAWGSETVKACIKIYISALHPVLPGEPLPNLKMVDNNIGQMLQGLEL